MRQFKTMYRVFTPDNYDREEQFLREMSLQGWHFRDTRGFIYTFEKGEPKSYSYKMDCMRRGRPDKEQYIAMYEDFGWEHVFEYKVFFFDGEWQYFRMESETGHEETLFSDDESKAALLTEIRAFFIRITVCVWGFNLVFNGLSIYRMASMGNWFIGMPFIALALWYGKIIYRLTGKIKQLRKTN